MTLEVIVNQLKEFVWGPVSLVFLVGTGVYLSYRVGFIQFTKFTMVIRHTLGRIFEKNIIFQ